MFVIGLATAAPVRRYTQAECWEAFTKAPQFPRLNRRSQAVLRKVLLGDNGIASRHLALDQVEDAFKLTPDILHARFARHAPELATQAAAKALAQVQARGETIDALIISTCTGYLCPGLTSYVSERLGLRRDALMLDLVGQGCGAAVPNLRTAEALIAGGKARRVLSVCVEICSAAFYIDDDPGVLVSACLFGDGAAAAVLSNESLPGQRRVHWGESTTLLSPEDRDYLRFEQRDGMLRNILARQVPALGAKHAETVLAETLQRAGLNRDQLSGWILHGGGRDVLNALQDRLRLNEEQIEPSRAVLHEYGNVSSPFLLFALAHALQTQAPGGWWWLSSFGAGFSCHGALLQVD